jgi:hypothetical protein
MNQPITEATAVNEPQVLTPYQQSIVAEQAKLTIDIKNLEDFLGTNEWCHLGQDEHNRIVFKLGSMRETLKVIDKQVEAFNAPPAE